MKDTMARLESLLDSKANQSELAGLGARLDASTVLLRRLDAEARRRARQARAAELKSLGPSSLARKPLHCVACDRPLQMVHGPNTCVRSFTCHASSQFKSVLLGTKREKFATRHKW